MAETSQTKRLLKHSTIYAAGNIARQLVGFLMLPIYTRFLTPADYGVVGLLTFAMSMMEPLFGARLGEAMPKYYFQEHDKTKQNSVISNALIVTALISTVTIIILFTLRNQTSKILFGTPNFELIIGLFGIQILTQAIEYYGMTYIRILQKPMLFIAASLSKLIVQLSLNIWLVVTLKLGVMGVVLSGVISSSTYALLLAGFIVFKAGYHFDRELAKKMLGFSWPLWFVGLALLYIYSGNRFYIRIFSSLDQVGLYELAAKFALILSSLVWMPFNQFWETERFRYYEEGNRSLFSKAFKLISITLIGIALCIGISAEPIIRLMAAPGFHDAYLAVPFLILGTILMCLNNFANFSFMVTEKTSLISYISYATMIIITAFNLVLIPKFGYVGAAGALALALLFQFLITLRVGRKHYDLGIEAGPVLVLLGACCAVFALSVFVFCSAELWKDIALKMVLLALTIGAAVTILWKNPDTQPAMVTALSRIKAKP